MMSRQCWAKFDWRSPLGAIALFIGTGSIVETPAQAVPEVTKDFKLAQVGVTSQINAPIPLNLKPRTHIPLPTNSDSSDGERYSRYDEYGDDHEHEDHHDHHRGNDSSNTIIIINPANHSNYESYESYSDQGGYIRIIRQQVVK
jgi:hypothetical protein